jgi:transcription elongation factor GreA
MLWPDAGAPSRPFVRAETARVNENPADARGVFEAGTEDNVADRVPMTTNGYERLKEELKQLKSVERVEASRAIEVARAHGDLRENAEYHAAKERQGFIEGRVKEIESKLAMAEVIDPSKLGGTKVAFGATVRFADADSGDEKTLQIVGLDEADLKVGKISITSPMARAMIGKTPGDEFRVAGPKPKSYEIVEVRFV